MIEVSNATKEAFLNDSSHKTLRISFPELALNIGNESIEVESLKIKESLCDGDNVEFVGCIASYMQISLYNVTANIKGKKIEAYIKADNTDEIPIFKGIVDSAVIDSTKLFKKITAYDVLYSKGETDVVDWYNTQFPADTSTKTLKQLRDSLCTYIGIDQVSTTLPNDSIVIGKKFDPKSLKCISVLKSICQINGCCGIINRQGKFEYRFIKEAYGGIYPSLYLYPSSTTIPQTRNVANTFAFYETLEFEEYFVKPMKRVQIRQSEAEAGVTVGSDSGNKYIIQSNMFAQGIEEADATTMATNILNKLKYASFYPCTTKNNGLPFVECGDGVKYVLAENRSGRYATNSFIVLSRTISGVQLLKDSYSASGNEEQSEFITDLQTTIDTLKMQGGGGSGDTYTKEETSELIDEKISASMLNVVSCAVLPESRVQGTIYLVQGDMWVG